MSCRLVLDPCNRRVSTHAQIASPAEKSGVWLSHVRKGGRQQMGKAQWSL